MRGILALLLSVCAMGAAVAGPTVEQFSKHSQYENVQLSPDGQYLAASVLVGGKRMLSLIHLTDFKGVNVAPRGDDELADYLWAGPDRVVYSVGTRLGGQEKPIPTGELFGVDADGGQNALLFGYRVAGMQTGTHLNVAKAENASAYLLASLPKDPKHVTIMVSKWNGAGDSATPEIRRMDVRDGKTVPMFMAPIRDPGYTLADHDGALRFISGEDVNGKYQVFYRDADGKGWEKVLDESEGGHVGRPLAFDRANAVSYWACWKDGAMGAVCTWSAKDRSFKPVWSDAKVAKYDLVTSLDDKDVVGVRAMPGRISVSLLDKSADSIKLIASLLPQFPGDAVQVVSRSLDGSRAVVNVHSDVNPGEFYLYDKASKKLSLLFARWPQIKPEALAPMEPFEMKARDGLALMGYVTRPPGKAEAKNLPMVVLVHGGPFGIFDKWEYTPDTQVLATNGYAVLQVNYRGSGGRDVGFVRAGWREWGGKMQDDVTDATKWAIEQGIADAKRICIMGGSYGGYAALESAVKEPDLYRCAIADAGVYDLKKLIGTTDGHFSTAGTNGMAREIGSDEAVLAQRSPLNQLDRLKAKVMLIAGGEDKRVPPEQAMAVHGALDQRGVKHEYLYERTEGHGFYDEGHVAAMYTKVLEFLAANIGDGAEKKTASN